MQLPEPSWPTCQDKVRLLTASHLLVQRADQLVFSVFAPERHYSLSTSLLVEV